MVKTIAVLGCFRSGTNFTKALLELNYTCKVVNDVFGWKHGVVPIVSNTLRSNFSFEYDGCYFITKNPYSFLYSLYKYFSTVGLNIKAHKGFSDFIRNEIIVFDQSQAKSPKMKFKNPVELWNFMNWHYHSLDNIKHVRYEKLIESPELIVSKLADKLDLKRLDASFVVPENKIKRMNDKGDYNGLLEYQTKEKFDRNVYSSNSYMLEYKKSDIDFVLNSLDHGLISSLGYKGLIDDLLS
ncbi:MAG: hypothetical protein ABJN96_07765 [Marinomonas sp.]